MKRQERAVRAAALREWAQSLREEYTLATFPSHGDLARILNEWSLDAFIAQVMREAADKADEAADDIEEGA